MLVSFKYYGLFYFVFVLLICIAMLEQQWLWYLLTALCAGRICWIDRKFRWALCLVSVLFYWRISALQTELTARQALPLHESASLMIQIDPHDVTEAPEMIRGEGTLHITNRTVPIQWYSRETGVIESFQQKAIIGVEQWSIIGSIHEVSPALNFNVFDYQNFLSKKGIYHSIEIHQLMQRKSPPHIFSRWTSFVYQLKIPLIRHDYLWVHLHNRLLYRLEDAAINDFMDLMSLWGVVHLFSISGIQVHWLRKKGVHLFAWSGMRLDRARGLMEILLFCYGWVIGWPIGILRALGTHYLRSFAKLFHWPLSRLDEIACVGMILLFLNPLQLYSLGFQLSFGLTIMIHLFMHQYPDFRSLSPLKQQGLLTSLSMLIVWPVMMHLSHHWYPLQWVMSLVISYFFSDYLLGMMIGTSILLFVGLGEVKAFWVFLSDGLTLFYEWAMYLNPMQLFEHITGHLSVFSLAILLLCPLIYLYRLKKSPLQTLVIIVGIYGLVLYIMPHFSSDAVITILYVGQGDALLIQWPHRQETWLIDTGGRMNWGEGTAEINHDEASRHLIPALKALGVNQLTGVIITHPDMDHMGNLVGLVEAIPVRHIYLTEYTAQSELFKSYLPLLKTIDPRIEYHLVLTEQPQIIVKGIIEVIAQDPSRIYSGDDVSNRTSIISALRFYGRTLLTLGDITTSEEEKYLPYFQKIQPDMIKLAHHGSHTGTSQHLLKGIQAQWAFISAGQDNRYGHPHPEVLQRLIKADYCYLSTSEVGAIQIRIQANGQYTVRVRQHLSAVQGAN
ncbi:ComEC/Rec2 family competence protein [Aerococcaceae bacterium DSM 111020]|nr:ComEC/Rec2 family competence protein [Aerococcaceae bacterium DSM 111020]